VLEQRGWLHRGGGAKSVIDEPGSTTSGDTDDPPSGLKHGGGHRHRVSIEIPGCTTAVTAVLLHDAEREQARKQMVTAAAQSARHRERTDCELPVIRLAREAGNEPGHAVGQRAAIAALATLRPNACPVSRSSTVSRSPRATKRLSPSASPKSTVHVVNGLSGV
jgi:hypothetical protein